MARENIEVFLRLKDDLSAGMKRVERQAKTTARELRGVADERTVRSWNAARGSAAHLGRGLTSLAAGAHLAGRASSGTHRDLSALARGMFITGAATSLLKSKVQELTHALLANAAAQRLAGKSALSSMLRGVGAAAGAAIGGVKTLAGALGGALKGAGERASEFGSSVLSALKIPAVLFAVNTLAGAIGVLGAGLVQGAAAVAPLAGALAALPGLLLAVKSSTAFFKFAVAPTQKAAAAVAKFGENSKQAQAAMKGFTPEARAFTKQLGALKRVQDSLRNAAQKGLFPGLTIALDNMQALVPLVRRNLTGLGRSLGDVARQGSAMVTTGPFKRDLDTILKRNSVVVHVLGLALLQVVSAIRHVMVAAGPLTLAIAKMVLHATKAANAFFAHQRATGGLGRFFKLTIRLLDHMRLGFDNLVIGIKNIGVIAFGFTQGFSGGLGHLLKRFRDFTDSVAGKNKIREFFANAQYPLHALLKLVGHLFKLFGGLGAGSAGGGKALGDIFTQIDTKILPALDRLLKGVGTKLGPAFVSLATAFLNFQGSLSFEPFITAVSIFAKLAEAASTLIDKVPGMGNLVATFLTMRLVMKGLNIVGVGGGLTRFAQGLIGVGGQADSLTGKLGAALRAKIALFGGKSIAAVGRGATALKYGAAGIGAGQLANDTGRGAAGASRLSKIGLGAGKLLGGAFTFLLSPLGLVIIAVAAVIAGLVYLYFHSKRFHDIVNRVASAVKNGLVSGFHQFVAGAKQIWSAMQAVGRVVASVFHQFMQGARQIWAVIKVVARVIEVLFAIALGLVISYFMALWWAVKKVWSGISAGATWLWRNVLHPVFSAVGHFIAAVWRGISHAAQWAWHKVSAGAAILWRLLMRGFHALMRPVHAVWNAISRGASTAWHWISSRAQALWERMKRGFSRLLAPILSIWRSISGAAGRAWDSITSRASRLWGRLKNGFGLVRDAVGNVWSSIASTARTAFDNVVTFLESMVNRAIDGINKLIGLAGKVGVNISPIEHIGGGPKLPPATGTSARDVTRWSGGPLAEGARYLVGERGPELGVFGRDMRLLGAHGPERIVAGRSGFVVPNHVLAAASASTSGRLPTGVLAALQRGSVLPSATDGYFPSAARVAALPTVEPAVVRAGGRPADQLGEAPIQVTVHVHQPQADVDVEQAVTRALRRDRQERERTVQPGMA